MKDNETLGLLVKVRHLREQRAEARLARDLASARRVKEAAQDEKFRHVSQMSQAVAAEHRRLQFITATIVHPSSLQGLDAERKRMDNETVRFEQQERSMQREVEQSLEKVKAARRHLMRQQASRMKLDEVIGWARRRSGCDIGGSADENEEWPS